MTPEKHLVVEMGIGGYPFPVDGRRQVSSGEYYIGFDLRHHETKSANRNLPLNSENIGLMTANAIQIPLPANCTSEIVICNLLGYIAQRETILPFLSFVFPGILPQIIAESKRVLKTDGQLTIVETITPDNVPYRYIKRLLTKNGFNNLPNQNKHNPNEILQYKKYIPKDNKHGTPYIATFTK